MSLLRPNMRLRSWFTSSITVLLVLASTYAFSLGETPTAELLNPQYSIKTSSFTFVLLNREKIPREYRFESHLYAQGTILRTTKHDIQPNFDSISASEKSNFALVATLSIPIQQVDPEEDGVYSLRVIANSSGTAGDDGIARMWIRFQLRGQDVRILSQSEYTDLIHQPDQTGEVGFSSPSRQDFGKVDPTDAHHMLPVVIAAEKAPIVEHVEKTESPEIEVRLKRPRGISTVQQMLRDRAVLKEHLRPSLEKKNVFVPPFKPLQPSDRTEVNE